MSEPWNATGRTERRPCDHCASEATWAEYVGAYGGSGGWLVEGKHDAPCGLPCLGAGVSGAVYRSKQVHGAMFACPACGIVGKTPASVVPL